MELTKAQGHQAWTEAVLKAIKALAPYIDDAVLTPNEYGMGDILLAPFIVSRVPRQASQVGCDATHNR